MKKSILIFILSFFFYDLAAQMNELSFQKHVLKKNIKDSLFTLNVSRSEEHDKIFLKYLGEVKSANGMKYKILNSYRIWGISKRATSRLIIYNTKYNYLGYYYLTRIDDLPVRISKNLLIFKSSKNCTPNIITKISFRDGIPKEIYLKCDAERGDVYSFSSKTYW